MGVTDGAYCITLGERHLGRRQLHMTATQVIGA